MIGQPVVRYGNFSIFRDGGRRHLGFLSPQLLAHVYCGQTAGWIKMALGVEVGLSPGYFVLDRTQIFCSKRGGAPSHRPMSIAAKWLHVLRCHLVRR